MEKQHKFLNLFYKVEGIIILFALSQDDWQLSQSPKELRKSLEKLGLGNLWGIRLVWILLFLQGRGLHL